MKVFVYEKKTNALKRIIEHVVEVRDCDKHIIYNNESGETFEVNKKLYKSTAYQN